MRSIAKIASAGLAAGLAALLPWAVAVGAELRPPGPREGFEFLRDGVMIRPSSPPAGAGPPAGGGQAVTAIVTELSVEDELAIVKEVGVSDAQAGLTSTNVKFIHGTSSGIAFAIYPRDCTQLCAGFDLVAYFGKQAEVDQAFISAFNTAVVSTLVLHKDGNLTLRYTIGLERGVTREHVKYFTDVFLQSIKSAIAFQPS